MKILKNIFLLSFLSLIMFSGSATAQFEGQITMNIYSNDSGKESVNQTNMYVTKERIFIKGEDNMNFGDSFNSGGLLIRNDKKDFVVLMENNDALQVTKSEIEGLFNMFSSWGAALQTIQTRTKKMNYEYTGEKRTIRGYETTELRLKGREDGVDTYMSIWLAPNVDIDWGMLANPWKNLPSDAEIAVNDISMNAVFKGKNFPMLVEVIDGDETETVMEVTNINKSNIAKAMVQIPTGVNLIGITELMFKMMSRN